MNDRLTDRSRGGPRRRIAGQRRPAAARLNGTTEAPEAPERRTDEEPGTTPEVAATNGTTEAPPAESAEVSSTETDKAEEKHEAAGERQASRAVRIVAGVVGFLVVMTGAIAVVLGHQAWEGHRLDQSRSQAMAAGRKAAELVLSYDYRTLDKDFAAARATLAPDFAADYDQTAKVVGEQAKQVKATVKAEVRDVGVRDGDENRMTLIIFVNQTTTSTITQNKPRVDLNRARFTMVRSGDRWLVGSIDGL